MPPKVVLDCSGARVGGAARFLGVLDQWLDREQRTDLAVIGRGRRLSAPWLIERELKHGRPSTTSIALNNVSFVGPAMRRIVLLRNALHFASSREFQAIGYRPSRRMVSQTPVVRRAAQRADWIVVPCRAMADRVNFFLPGVAERVLVRPHPVDRRPWSGRHATERALLVPSSNDAHKGLAANLDLLRKAEGLRSAVDRVYVTADAGELPGDIAGDSLFAFIGSRSAADLDDYWRRCAAVYFPTELESFGYPLAEARANGRRVVALNTAQSREIAGRALAPYEKGSPESLGHAVSMAMEHPVGPDPDQFDPHGYFTWLINELPLAGGR